MLMLPRPRESTAATKAKLDWGERRCRRTPATYRIKNPGFSPGPGQRDARPKPKFDLGVHAARTLDASTSKASLDVFRVALSPHRIATAGQISIASAAPNFGFWIRGILSSSPI